VVSRPRGRAVRTSVLRLIESGALSFFGAVVPVSPVYDGTFFPSEMFLYCASNADYVYVNAKESLVENVASPLPVADTR